MDWVNQAGVIKKGNLAARDEVKKLKGAMKAAGIANIDDYIEKIVEVTTNPRPEGFKFQCRNYGELATRMRGEKIAALVRPKPKGKPSLFQMRSPDDPGSLSYNNLPATDGSFQYDDPSTPDGAFNGRAGANGQSIRQKGQGMSLHVVVGPITDCHLDSHGIRTCGGVNDFDSLSDHLTYDLGPELPVVSYLYHAIGENATFGPFVKVKHIDGFNFEFVAGFHIYGKF